MARLRRLDSSRTGFDDSSPKEKTMRMILTLATLMFGVAGCVWAADKTYPEIKHDELVSALAARTVTLLDANGTDSYKQGHIPGAYDFASVKNRLAAVLPADKSALIVAYCSNEDCPAYQEAATAAESLGYTNVKHYAMGIMGWKESGAKVETGK
jgi:rhodanese-related sulfurtransferase